jgi:hypothetical protein
MSEIENRTKLEYFSIFAIIEILDLKSIVLISNHRRFRNIEYANLNWYIEYSIQYNENAKLRYI